MGALPDRPGGFGLACWALVICGRFFYLQVIKGPQLRELATREYQKFCPVLPVRGMIVDRKGLELAISTRVSSVVAHPLQIKHADRLSRELAPILGFKPRELKELLTRATSFVWVKRQLTPEREAAFQAWAGGGGPPGQGRQDHRQTGHRRHLSDPRGQTLLSAALSGRTGPGVLQY